MPATADSLANNSLSLAHQYLSKVLQEQENILIIQDLDGVCMGLVQDPLTRIIEPKYVRAVKSLANHFFVLTNGEHIGQRGVNHIIEQALAPEPATGWYLPGLAGGGVQWQDSQGQVSHPGVSQAEMDFLAAVPQRMADFLGQLGQAAPYNLESSQLEQCLQAAILDNQVSPTANLNVFHELFQDRPGLYASWQQAVQGLIENLLQEAQAQGLGSSFFVHYAPNLGRDPQGKEIMQPAQGQDSGTTDFQFMLKGAIKEVGVLVILNRYYYQRTGSYPLGADFNARSAPQKQQELLQLVQDNFAPELMPLIMGVGDTVTSKAVEANGQLEFKRGGSDRGFLELVQALGAKFSTDNVVVYVDSSAGEVRNRQALQLDLSDPQNHRVIQGPGDPRDTSDPLTLNFVFPEGHQQYVNFFCRLADARSKLGFQDN